MFSRLMIASLVLGSLSAVAQAASPSLGIIQPRGAQRGTDAVVTFQGARFTDAQEVVVYYPGITVKKLEVVNDASVKVTLTIAPDCRLGEHAFRIRTATGLSELRTFWVGALPSVDELEPNSEFDKPQPVTLNTTVHGSIGGEDVDYFVVDCKKGQRLAAEIEGQRLAGGFWDPYIAILDSKRFELAMSDDSPMSMQDGGCSIVVPMDGKYIVQVRESTYGGGNQYRLHIGNFPRPTAVIPSGGKPGEELEVRFIGDPAGEIKQKIKLPATADADFRLHCQTPEGISPTGFKFRLGTLTNVAEVANANTPATALVGTAPCAFNGAISVAGEVDHLRFTAKQGEVYEIHCYARRGGSPLDSVMRLFAWTNNALGANLVNNDDAIGPDSYFRFGIPANGEYVILLDDHLKKGGPDYFYRVELTPVAAATTTNLQKVDGNNVSNQDRQTIVVPKGNRFAAMVQVNRADWGGPATIGFDVLPPGLGFVADSVDPGLGAIPVVFEATPAAATGGKLVDFKATPADPKLIALSRTMMDVNFNLALNNTPFHRLYNDRIAVAVAEPAPYSIEVIEPKVGVPQNGSMNLKVVAKRAPGFTKAITVFPLFTPPGMGIQGSAVIPENGTEALLPMNAAPNAAPRKWKTAVTAVADNGTGPVWVSSQLFTLEVAPPFVTFAQDRAAVEQGNNTPVFIKVTVNTPFEGTAKANLVALPAKALAPVMDITKATKEISFAVTTDKTTPAGKHGVFCQVVLVVNGETVVLSAGGNELRVDVPLPPKPAVVAVATPTPTPAPVATPAKPPEKRLSRLEQLRLEQEEREKAAKAPPAAPATPAPAAPAPAPATPAPGPKKEEPKK